MMLGHPIMVLVVLTEPEPREALTRLMKRCAYVAFPISILWIKYYPVLGRHFGTDGAAQNSGIALGKNELGAVSIIFALFFFWNALQVRREKWMSGRRPELFLNLGLLLLAGYCLFKAHSATSALSLMLAGLVVLGLGLRLVDKRRVRAYAVIVIMILVLAQGVFDLFGNIVAATGHSSTLEGRGRLWEVLLATDHSPILGAGYESYWSGERLQKIWSMPEFWWKPIQAHNGYIEIYLNLGIVGLIILVGVLFVTFGKCYRELIDQFEWGRLTMGYFVMILVHNWTEAGFKGLSLIFFAFFLVAIRSPRHIDVSMETQPFAAKTEDDFAYAGAGKWRLDCSRV
jgi:O-antigen ligase